ncbi:methyltransferase domain-containing protein [Shewanella sp.]|uniref:class I SAM-dependent methyltransferase n=1 Tax=Shewanella sp. TaxID=50422 RepID=UPI001B5DF290|nr:methyltransferase domain-containing protein [Shewanella sp.]MBP6518106.1 methyltransferase domain-containing protein [Shewanella sp.]
MAQLRVRYQTHEFGDLDIHVRTLRNNQEFEDLDGEAEKLGISSATWPLFGIVWPSSQVLSHHMADYQIDNKRILEVGCGIGLASLVLNHRHADITATDYHPESENFLKQNVDLNHGRAIPFVRTVWADAQTNLGLFDLIIGSDLLYEQEHADLLSQFIEQHAKPICDVVLVDPGRGNHAKFSKRMVTLGYEHTQHKPIHTEFLLAPFGGQILNYSRTNS